MARKEVDNKWGWGVPGKERQKRIYGDLKEVEMEHWKRTNRAEE